MTNTSAPTKAVKNIVVDPEQAAIREIKQITRSHNWGKVGFLTYMDGLEWGLARRLKNAIENLGIEAQIAIDTVGSTPATKTD